MTVITGCLYPLLCNGVNGEWSMVNTLPISKKSEIGGPHHCSEKCRIREPTHH
jgi:hypothetical protein